LIISKIFLWQKVKNFVEFIFADDHYLFIFADLGEKRKIPQKQVPHNFLPQTISSLKVVCILDLTNFSHFSSRAGKILPSHPKKSVNWLK